MMVNGDEVMAARDLDRETKQNAKDKKAKDQEDKEIELFELASLKYQVFVEEKDRDLQKMSPDDLTPIVKFLCAVDHRGTGDCVSNYSSKAKKIERIMRTGSAHWTSWFDPHFGEEAEAAVEAPQLEAEEGKEEESGSD